VKYWGLTTATTGEKLSELSPSSNTDATMESSRSAMFCAVNERLRLSPRVVEEPQDNCMAVAGYSTKKFI